MMTKKTGLKDCARNCTQAKKPESRVKTSKENFAIWHEGASENRISYHFVVVLFSEASNVS